MDIHYRYPLNSDLKKNIALKVKKRRGLFLLVVPLILSAYTHLWNPIGFPSIQTDEGTYMRRALMIIEKIGVHEGDNIYTKPYDHPYFGQLFLASILSLVGYPDVIDPVSTSLDTVQALYFTPRIVMGILAVIDTFIVYKIAERSYDRRVGLIAASSIRSHAVELVVKKNLA